jgi:aminoglycoside N3'-acetyltransferase
MSLTQAEILKAIEQAGLSGCVVCLHSSLKSFGRVEGGPDAVIDAFRDAGCTLIVPTFTYACQVPPPAGWSVAQNGETPDRFVNREPIEAFDRNGQRITREEMGAIPARVLQYPEHVRGNHPADSFTGLGPLASGVIAEQSPRNVFGTYKAIYSGLPARLVLAGVGLTAATAIHFAEELSGRRLFRRWGRLAGGRDIEVEEGGCSEGFENLASAVAFLEQRIVVGESLWRIYPFQEFVDAIVAAIRKNPAVTHCGDPACPRCNDAVKGGPLPAGSRGK